MLQNVIQVSHSKVEALFPRFWETKLSFFLWGTFGIGKSFIIREACKRVAMAMSLKFSEDLADAADDTFVFSVVNLHQFDAAEFKGLPVPDYDKKITTFFTTGALPTKGYGFIFFDEVNLAPPLVQASSYSLSLDRKLGDYRLPDGWMVAMAGNTFADRAHVQEMALPLKNRLDHLELKTPDVKGWTEGFAYANNINPIIINFLLFKEDCLHNYDPEDQEEVTVVATPRTWALASKLIEGVESPSLIADLMATYVGSTIAKQVEAFAESMLTVKIHDCFTTGVLPYDKVAFKQKPDITYAFIGSICSYYNKNMTEAYTKTVIDWLPLFSDEHATVLANQLAQITKANPKGFYAMVRTLDAKYVKAVTKYLATMI